MEENKQIDQPNTDQQENKKDVSEFKEVIRRKSVRFEVFEAEPQSEPSGNTKQLEDVLANITEEDNQNVTIDEDKP